LTTRDDYRKQARCPCCRLTPGLCACDSLPRIELPFWVLIVQHVKERDKLSNTGALARRMLRRSELHLFGARDRPFDDALLRDLQTDYFILHPGPDAALLAPGMLAPKPGRKSALVVLDARWSQSRRMARRVPGITGLPAVTLPEDVPDSYQFRKAPAPGRYSTVDAINLAIRCAGHSAAADRMQAALLSLRPLLRHVRGWDRRPSAAHLRP